MVKFDTKITKVNRNERYKCGDRVTSDNDCISVIIDGTPMTLPQDPDNRHYAEIMRQVEAGDLTIAAAD